MNIKNIFRKLTKKIGLTTTKTNVFEYLHQSVYDDGLGKPTPENYTEYAESYQQEVWVYSCVYRISNTIAGLPIKLYKPINKNGNVYYDEVKEHAFLNLIERPNSYQSKTDLLEALIGNAELTGNGYMLLDEMNSQKQPAKLYILPSNRVRISGQLPDKLKYIYTTGVSTKTLTNEEVLQLKYFNPLDDYYGLSPIASARYIIEANEEAYKFNKKFFERGASLDGVLETDQQLSPETFYRLKEQFNERYTGSENAHKTALLEAGLKYKSIAISQRDMEFINGMKLNRENICAIFGVPPALVGVFEYANYANSESQIKMYWNNTIIPKIQKVRYFLQRLVDRYDSSLFVDFDLSQVEALRENEDLKSQIAVRYFNMGIPINTIIENLNLPFNKIPNGDVGYIPFNLVPIGTKPESKDNTTPATQESAGQVEEQQRQGTRTIKSRTEFDRKKWDLMIKVTEQLESKYTEALREYFKQQEALVIENLNKFKSLSIKQEKLGYYICEETVDENNQQVKQPIDIDVILFSEDQEIERFIKISKPYRMLAIEEAGTTEFELLNMAIEFNMNSDNVVDFLEKHGYKKGKLIIDTAADAIKTTLIESVKEGLSVNEISKRIREVYLQYTGEGLQAYASMRIARTEIIESSNFGNIEAYRQAGVKKMEWITAFDEVTCPICSGLDGEQTEVGGVFKGGFNQPPDPHPNCRCTLKPVIND